MQLVYEALIIYDTNEVRCDLCRAQQPILDSPEAWMIFLGNIFTPELLHVDFEHNPSKKKIFWLCVVYYLLREGQNATIL